jgi:hypothetical protein
MSRTQFYWRGLCGNRDIRFYTSSHFSVFIDNSQAACRRVSFAAHTDGGFVLLQHLRTVLRSVLHAAVGMVHQAGSRPPLDQCHAQRGYGQLGF